MKTILVVEDNAGVRDLLREYLTEQGYQVLVSNNGREGLLTARHHRPDLVLLDIMMPEMDGLDFLKQFRKSFEVPVIFVTARVQELDKILGLELGADDYITKPFSMGEMLARIRAVLRRSEAPVKQDVLSVHGLVVDREARVVRVEGQKVDLTRAEFNLLSHMMASPGKVFSRTALLDALGDEDSLASERTIDVHIKNLRRKIETEPAQPRWILTVFGVGYRLDPGQG